MYGYMYLTALNLIHLEHKTFLVIASGLYEVTENTCFCMMAATACNFVSIRQECLCHHNDCYHIVMSVTSLMERCICVWQCVTADSFIPCLVDLCKALWGIMNSYHQVVSWHQRKDSQKLSTGEADMVLLLIQYDTGFSGLTFMLPSP